MKRAIFCAALTLLFVLPLAAQTPKGWKLRIDRSTNASDPDAAGDIKFVETGSSFHATNPQAAVYWNPSNTVTGNYSLTGTFTLVKSMRHSEYYGLIFGGKDLEGQSQTYLYFMVAQDGTWLVKRRDGNSTENVSMKTASDAVRKPDESGKSTNTLEVRVMPDKIDYLVNGAKVYTTPKTGQSANTDGIYGIRVNHMLEVKIDGFKVLKE
ncbi:MAG: hypothetical protein HYX72_06600 [Acidobacteria bacterium]|nr:hypothetical protein [Acidobacteriota bacterium]